MGCYIILNLSIFFNLTALGLGGLLLCSSILLAMIITLFKGMWLALMFFLIFVSGLLVLCFYVLSVDYGSWVLTSGVGGLKKMELVVFMNIVYWVWWHSSAMTFYSCSTQTYFSSHLFSSNEFILVMLFGIFLFYCLWLIIKLVMKNSGSSLRPYF